MPEITKTEGGNAGRRQTEIRFLFTMFVIAFYMFGLTIPMVGPDEPRYAQVAREMFERGDWVTPTLGGFNWFEKPALLYWLEIASYHIFGVSEFSARFGSALFGLGTIFSLWLFGRFAYDSAPGSGVEDSKRFADLLSMIAASTLGIIVFSRGASFDIILTFPMTASLVCFFIYDSRERSTNGGELRSLIWLGGFYFFIGVSLLAKGLIGAVFPLAIVAFYYLLSFRPPSKAVVLSLIWGAIIALAVASLWYLPMYLRHGYAFIDEFFIQHHFQRYTSNKYFHPQPFYFFLWVLPLMTIPWLPFFIAGFWEKVRRGSRNSGEALNYRSGSTFRFAAAWLSVPLVFFSFSGSKLPGYILPAVPAALIIAAVYLQRIIAGSPKWKWLVHGVAAATFAVVILLLQFIVPEYAYQDSVKGLIGTADRAGYQNTRILSLHTTSHNAEFYGAGRLLRSADGKQRKLLGVLEVVDYLNSSGEESALVLVPHEFASQLVSSERLVTTVLDQSGELAIVVVRLNSDQSSTARRSRSIKAVPMPFSSTSSQ